MSVHAQGPWVDLALHTIGWKAFQDLCSQVCEEVLRRPVEIFRDAQDGGQDAVFSLRSPSGLDTTATVQCKHSSRADARLRPAALRRELALVAELVQSEQCHTYVLMTSMGVDAPVAADIKKRLLSLGVKKAHVLGREYLIRSIRSNARLRALVPQVYGLGDLSAILDERTRDQTRALLDQWLPKLGVYVPTEAHRKAVRALDRHGLVLLLGNPSSGNSTIGAILSTMAADNPEHTVFSLTSPRDFEVSWNPHDPGRFFWIDDAFGSNVVREEYVQDWTAAFPKVQAAIRHGNRFLLTSRRHIYEAARVRLGQRNLPPLLDGTAVVDVGALTLEERRQILYNHVAFGRQTQTWKTSAKRHLDAVAQVDDFLPGIAERLGDPAFTKNLPLTADALRRFMQEPKAYLIDTINALDEPLRAALILVYAHQGRLVEQAMDRAAAEAVSRMCGVVLAKVQSSLPDLLGSFIQLSKGASGNTWRFSHPTIADAISDMLKGRPHMIAALLRGAPIDTVFSTCVCEGADAVDDALRVPEELASVLVARLVEAPYDIYLNYSLFAFLAGRTTDSVFKQTLERAPHLLQRRHYWPERKSSDPTYQVFARAYRLNCLPESDRVEAALALEDAAASEGDLSWLGEPDMLALLGPSRLLALGMRLQARILGDTPMSISCTVDDFDPELQTHGVLDKFSEGIDALLEIDGLDDESIALINEARASLIIGEDQIRQKINAARGRDAQPSWTAMSAESSTPAPAGPSWRARSIFDDVDGVGADSEVDTDV